MADQPKTQGKSLVGRMDDLEKEVQGLKETTTQGFYKLEKQLSDIATSIQLNALTAEKAADERYTQRKEDMALAMARLDDEMYRKKASGIIDDWADSEHGCEKMGKAYTYWLEKNRDSAIKWWTLLKIVAAVSVSVAGYAGGAKIIATQSKILNGQSNIQHDVENVKGE